MVCTFPLSLEFDLIQQLTRDEQCTITYGATHCLIQDLTSKKPIRVSEERNGVYYLKCEGGTILAAIQNQKSELWRQRLGHPSFGSLSSLS